MNFNEVPLLIEDKGVLSIDENSLPGSMVQGGPITASDVDDNSLTFIIVGGSGANSFYFANSYAYKDQAGYFTTDVLLKPGVELNFESNAAALTLDIFCKDEKGLVSATKTYSISISNINDKPTLASLLSVTIPENSGEGTLLGTITYNDEDSQQTVTFMLDGQKLGDGHTAYSCWSVEADPSTVLLTPFPFQLTESGNIDIVFELSLNSGQAILALQSLSHTACNEVPNDSPKPLASTLYEISFDWISTNVIRTQLRATTASNCGNYAESTNDPLGTNEFDLIKEEKLPIWFWMNIRVGENEIDHGSIKIGHGKTFKDPGIDASVSGTHAIKQLSFSSGLGQVASIRNLCTKSIGAIQNGILQSENNLFNVAPTSGNVFVGVGILGGPHGTLDYERNRVYGIVIKGQDSGVPPYHDTGHMRIHLSDINEPPRFRNNCVHANFIGCYTINEVSNVIGPAPNGIWSNLQVYDVDIADDVT